MSPKPKGTKVRKILVPTDFTSHSEKAVDYAAGLARSFGASLLLLHVIEPFTYTVSDTVQVTDHYAALRTIAEPMMKNLEDGLGKKGLRATGLIVKGTPYLEIVKKARQEGADMIILSTHGHSGLRHLLIGSVAERVVRLAHCPVLTVRG